MTSDDLAFILGIIALVVSLYIVSQDASFMQLFFGG